MTTNDAAERLLFTHNLTASGWVHAPVEDVRAALAAERRATVERIERKLDDWWEGRIPQDVRDILDVEAKR